MIPENEQKKNYLLLFITAGFFLAVLGGFFSVIIARPYLTTTVYQSALTQEWVGVVFGGYFAAMGVFAFGCAAGNCYGGKCAVDPGKNTAMTLQEVELPEAKP